MRTISCLTLAVFVMSSLLFVPPSAAGTEPDSPPKVECEGKTKTGITELQGRVKYAFTYNKSAQRVCTVAESTGEEEELFGYSVWIDGSKILDTDTKEIEPGDTFSEKQIITNGIDATRNNHTVEVHTYNGTFYFNFTQKVDTMNEGGVPTPHFESLRVKRNGTRSGQPRIVLEVENEGIRTYVPEGEVRTLESDSRHLGDVPDASPGGRYSVRLSEGNDDVIVGTVRLYGGKFNPGTKFDRVSFVSYPNGTYETWEPEFGEIPTDREIEEREVYYENASARKRYRGPDVDPFSERASKVGAVVAVAVVGVGLWAWRRRKRR